MTDELLLRLAQDLDGTVEGDVVLGKCYPYECRLRRTASGVEVDLDRSYSGTITIRRSPGAYSDELGEDLSVEATPYQFLSMFCSVPQRVDLVRELLEREGDSLELGLDRMTARFNLDAADWSAVPGRLHRMASLAGLGIDGPGGSVGLVMGVEQRYRPPNYRDRYIPVTAKQWGCFAQILGAFFLLTLLGPHGTPDRPNRSGRSQPTPWQAPAPSLTPTPDPRLPALTGWFSYTGGWKVVRALDVAEDGNTVRDGGRVEAIYGNGPLTSVSFAVVAAGGTPQCKITLAGAHLSVAWQTTGCVIGLQDGNAVTVPQATGVTPQITLIPGDPESVQVVGAGQFTGPRNEMPGDDPGKLIFEVSGGSASLSDLRGL